MREWLAMRLMISLSIGILALSACSIGGSQTATGMPTRLAATAGVIVSPTQPQAETPTAAQLAASSPVAAQAATVQPVPAGGTQTAVVPATGSQDGIPTDQVIAFPDPAGFTWAQVVSGLNKPLGMATPPNDPNKMFVLEQAGTIRVVQNGSLLPDPLLDITDRVGSAGNEQGLLGIALHPDFASNGYFYVNYTDTNGNTVIARFHVSQSDANRADPNSEKVLLHVDQPFPNHNGGSMVFGPDGFLYMGLGDGGSAGDPHGNGQSVNTWLGKLLRVDVNSGDPYAIPPSNPFANGGGKPEIWAYGLRNPWRFSFDRLTGDLYIADVGQNSWEEIDFSPAGSPGGADFGWNYREGAHAFRGNPPADAKLIEPVSEYSHADGCSVTGGYVYRGQALPEFRGIYLFSDYCSGKIWGLLRAADGSWSSNVLFDNTGYNVTSFGQDNQGEIYLIDQGSGSILRLQKK
jgi:glucose/arabinose dehydrogenase